MLLSAECGDRRVPFVITLADWEHFIPTVGAYDWEHFYMDGAHYLVVGNSGANSVLFQWSGAELCRCSLSPPWVLGVGST